MAHFTPKERYFMQIFNNFQAPTPIQLAPKFELGKNVVQFFASDSKKSSKYCESNESRLTKFL